jgi:hypothetical protein
MEDTCVCCGEYIPEGRMVCYSCEELPYSKVIIGERGKKMSIEKQRPYKEILIEQVKALGQEVIDRAEDLVGDGDLIADFDIWLRFPQDLSFPTIEVKRSHASRRYLDILNK